MDCVDLKMIKIMRINMIVLLTLKKIRHAFLHLSKSTHKNNSGQSSIEFLTTFIFVFGLLVLFVRFALNATNGFHVHYATYMASRAYLSHEDNGNNVLDSDEDAAREARQVFAEIYPQFPLQNVIIRSPSSEGLRLFTGVVARFKQKMSFGKLMGNTQDVDFISESFLGREPTINECANRTCQAISSVGGEPTCKIFATTFDNGC